MELDRGIDSEKWTWNVTILRPTPTLPWPSRGDLQQLVLFYFQVHLPGSLLLATEHACVLFVFNINICICLKFWDKFASNRTNTRCRTWRWYEQDPLLNLNGPFYLWKSEGPFSFLSCCQSRSRLMYKNFMIALIVDFTRPTSTSHQVCSQVSFQVHFPMLSKLDASQVLKQTDR